MESIRSSSLPAELSFRPSLKSAAVSTWCPDCPIDLTHRPRTIGIIEFVPTVSIRGMQVSFFPLVNTT